MSAKPLHDFRKTLIFPDFQSSLPPTNTRVECGEDSSIGDGWSESLASCSHPDVVGGEAAGLLKGLLCTSEEQALFLGHCRFSPA